MDVDVDGHAHGRGLGGLGRARGRELGGGRRGVPRDDEVPPLPGELARREPGADVHQVRRRRRLPVDPRGGLHGMQRVLAAVLRHVHPPRPRRGAELFQEPHARGHQGLPPPRRRGPPPAVPPERAAERRFRVREVHRRPEEAREDGDAERLLPGQEERGDKKREGPGAPPPPVRRGAGEGVRQRSRGGGLRARPGARRARAHHRRGAGAAPQGGHDGREHGRVALGQHDHLPARLHQGQVHDGLLAHLARAGRHGAGPLHGARRRLRDGRHPDVDDRLLRVRRRRGLDGQRQRRRRARAQALQRAHRRRALRGAPARPDGRRRGHGQPRRRDARHVHGGGRHVPQQLEPAARPPREAPGVVEDPEARGPFFCQDSVAVPRPGVRAPADGAPGPAVGVQGRRRGEREDGGGALRAHDLLRLRPVVGHLRRHPAPAQPGQPLLPEGARALQRRLADARVGEEGPGHVLPGPGGLRRRLALRRFRRGAGHGDGDLLLPRHDAHLRRRGRRPRQGRRGRLRRRREPRLRRPVPPRQDPGRVGEIRLHADARRGGLGQGQGHLRQRRDRGARVALRLQHVRRRHGLRAPVGPHAAPRRVVRVQERAPGHEAVGRHARRGLRDAPGEQRHAEQQAPRGHLARHRAVDGLLRARLLDDGVGQVEAAEPHEHHHVFRHNTAEI
ncbi:expressed protein, partial [Aureococcus anophagefferens]